MKYVFLFLGLGILLTSCASVKTDSVYKPETLSETPDYSTEYFWAALPGKIDDADKSPKGLKDLQNQSEADVFFLHPTIYTGKKGDKDWNASVLDEELNKKVDERTIRYQASIFNGAGRVYAPRYRQAHIKIYYQNDTALAQQVLGFAYLDIKAAFSYYLKHFNEGRPIIIASHSQGTTHAMQLIKEFFDGKPLQNQLVAAYLVGMPVFKDEFEDIPVCQSSDETGCFVSWRTFKFGYDPSWLTSDRVAVVNPLTWRTDTDMAPKSLNKGGVLKNFKKVHKEICDAKVVADDGILWTHKPKFFGSFLLKTNNYHIADFNFYYINVRENAQERVKAFLNGQKVITKNEDH